MKKLIVFLSMLSTTVIPMTAQPQRLTLDDCREMAVRNDKELQQAGTQVRMAGYDRKIAFANYLPNVSATGA